MLTERLQILVSPEQKRRWETEAAAEGTSVGGLVRAAVEARYARTTSAQRAKALDEIETMHARLPGDPAELDSQIDAARLSEAEAGVAAADAT